MEGTEISYSVENFDPAPDEELICSICHCVFDDPTECPCRHAFCKPCINSWLAERKNCPICRKKTQKADLKKVPLIITNMIDKLKMICSNRSKGCRQKVPMGSYSAHLKVCPYQETKCTNPGCSTLCLRKSLEAHATKQCQFRVVRCDKQCKLNVVASQVNSHCCITALLKDKSENESKMKGQIEDLKNEIQDLKSELAANKLRIRDLERHHRTYSSSYVTSLNNNISSDDSSFDSSNAMDTITAVGSTFTQMLRASIWRRVLDNNLVEISDSDEDSDNPREVSTNGTAASTSSSRETGDSRTPAASHNTLRAEAGAAAPTHNGSPSSRSSTSSDRDSRPPAASNSTPRAGRRRRFSSLSSLSSDSSDSRPLATGANAGTFSFSSLSSTSDSSDSALLAARATGGSRTRHFSSLSSSSESSDARPLAARANAGSRSRYRSISSISSTSDSIDERTNAGSRTHYFSSLSSSDDNDIPSPVQRSNLKRSFSRRQPLSSDSSSDSSPTVRRARQSLVLSSSDSSDTTAQGEASISSRTNENSRPLNLSSVISTDDSSDNDILIDDNEGSDYNVRVPVRTIDLMTRYANESSGESWTP